MTNPFRSVDSLETEGDAREAYAAWLVDMEDVIVKSYEVVSVSTEDTLIDFVQGEKSTTGQARNVLFIKDLQGHKNDEIDEIAFRKSFRNNELQLELV